MIDFLFFLRKIQGSRLYGKFTGELLFFWTRPLRTWTMLFGSLHFFTKSKTVQLLGFSAPWQMCRRRTSKTDLNVSFFWNIFVQKSLKHQNKAFWEVLSRFRVKNREKVEASTKMFFFLGASMAFCIFVPLKKKKVPNKIKMPQSFRGNLQRIDNLCTI